MTLLQNNNYCITLTHYVEMHAHHICWGTEIENKIIDIN